MFDLIMRGGPYMWPLIILAIVNIVLITKKTVELFIKPASNSIQLERGINAIMYWGILSGVLGFYAHFMGIYLAMQEIMAAADISPAIVAGGYAMSLITVLFGLNIFMISSLFWFAFRWRFKQLTASVN